MFLSDRRLRLRKNAAPDRFCGEELHFERPVKDIIYSCNVYHPGKYKSQSGIIFFLAVCVDLILDRKYLVHCRSRYHTGL